MLSKVPTEIAKFIRIKRSFARKDRLNIKQLDSIEHSLNKAGISIKIEPVADGIILYHRASTNFAKDLRALIAPFVTFVEGARLPASYVEIFNSMTNETIYIAADNTRYMEMCSKVIQLLAKDMKEAENPLTQH